MLRTNQASSGQRSDTSVPALRRTLEKVVIDRKESPRSSQYEPEAQAEWARERLLGAAATAAPEDEMEQRLEDRIRSTQANAWCKLDAKGELSQVGIEPSVVDQLEETLRSKLGLLTSQLGTDARAARALFAECDPSRSGRVERSAFVATMTKKLNYDFPARGTLPRRVLRAPRPLPSAPYPVPLTQHKPPT